MAAYIEYELTVKESPTSTRTEGWLTPAQILERLDLYATSKDSYVLSHQDEIMVAELNQAAGTIVDYTVAEFRAKYGA